LFVFIRALWFSILIVFHIRFKSSFKNKQVISVTYIQLAIDYIVSKFRLFVNFSMKLDYLIFQYSFYHFVNHH